MFAVITKAVVLIVIFIMAIKVYDEISRRNAMHIVEKYLSDTYDYEWRIEGVEYDLLMDVYVVSVLAEDMPGVDQFEVHVKNGVVASESFFEKYTVYRMKEYLTTAFSGIWGKGVQVTVELEAPDMRRCPLIYSIDSSLKRVLSDDMIFFERDLFIESFLETDDEIFTENMWETICWMRNEFPDWKRLIYMKEGSEEKYVIENIHETNDPESVLNTIKVEYW